MQEPMKASSIAIAQPTFLPWAGWFDLADQVDVLVLLDDVAFSKQSWQQRNRLRNPAGLGYVTVPVRTSGRLGQAIKDTEIADTQYEEKLIRTVRQQYQRAAHLSRYFDQFCEALSKGFATGNLCELNCEIIAWLASSLGVRTPIVRASNLAVGGKRGAHVAMLCERLGGSRYLSPPGAEDYLIEDREEFSSRSIAVQIHVYEHPQYRQCFEPFVPYASVLDLLLNEGDGAADILRSGRRRPRDLAVDESSQAGAM
jgi:hypothetical protein